MKLQRLAKDFNSETGQCPAMYVAEGDAGVMVVQGKFLDEHTTSELTDLAVDETGVQVPTETVLRAAGRLLAQYGRRGVADEIEAYLAERGCEQK